MGLTFANPWGLLGLLAIPAIILIHMLQRKARETPVAVLFLLEELQRRSQGGNRMERLRRSLPLWLQLLMALILTWLLVEPRRVEKAGVRRVAVVLDGSASMRAAKEEAARLLAEDLGKAESLAATTEYFVIDSRLRGGHLYHGAELSGVRDALKTWDPTSGEHDSAPSLRVARGLVGRAGLVLYVTDRKPSSLGSDARLFAAGKPLENTGIAGVSVTTEEGRTVWRATVRNYGKAPAARSWTVAHGDSATPPRELSLAAGQGQVIQAAFPDGVDTITLTLSADGFPVDDRAVIQRPKPKPLRWSPPAEGVDEPHIRLFSELPGLVTVGVGETPDLLVRHYDPLDPAMPDRPASCLFVRDPRGLTPRLTGELLTERHPYTDGLNWQGLICQEAMRIPAKQGDRVLLWQGDRPLVYLGGGTGAERLCFNFDPRKSNAPRMPAFVIGVSRFVEEIRQGLVAEEWLQAECGQALRPAVMTGPDAPELTITEETSAGKTTRTLAASAAALLRAPELPGTLEARQGNRLLLRAGAHFADVRESDFSACVTDTPTEEAFAGGTEDLTRENDPAWRFHILLLLALAALSWLAVARSSRSETPGGNPVPAP